MVYIHIYTYVIHCVLCICAYFLILNTDETRSNPYSPEVMSTTSTWISISRYLSLLNMPEPLEEMADFNTGTYSCARK